MVDTTPEAGSILKHFESLSEEGREREICALDPFYFLTRYVKTHDPYHGIRPYPDFGYIEHTIHSEQDNRLNLYVKGRQLTFSWTFAAHGLWESQFQYAANSMYTSKRLEDAFELKERAQVMWERLPEWLRWPLTESNKSTMAFAGNLSRLKFLPATDNVGRTYTAGHVYMDEFAHVTCNAGKMYTSIKPTINAGGRCTIFSSPNGPYGKFYDLADGPDCPNSGWGVMLKSGFMYHFMPYNVHPEHGVEWEKAAFRGMTREEIDQEYRALWVKRGGRVYPLFDKKVHVCPPFEIPASWPRVRAIDFGGSNPTAVTWIAFSPKGQAIIYKEYKQNQRPVEEHANEVKERSGHDRFSLGAVSDHDSQNRIEWERNGFRTQPALKDWDLGFNEVTRHLMVDAEGNPGLIVFDTCVDTISEFELYSWPEVDHSKRDTPERPLQINDHLMDAIRYALTTTQGRRVAFIPVREISEKTALESVNAGLLNPSPISRVNSILIPSTGLSVGQIHHQLGAQPIQRLGL